MNLFYFLLLIYLYGCMVPRGYALSEFYYNDKKWNWMIVSRVLDYGDGHRDGCIIMQECRLSLHTLRGGIFQGEVTNVDTNMPLASVDVLVQFESGDTVQKLTSDTSGKFSFTGASKVKRITISTPGYRSLMVDLKN